MNRGKKLEYLVTCVFMGILLLFMLSIAARLFVRQILIKRMRIENAFTRLMFWDNLEMALVYPDDYISINWAEYFPFEEPEVRREEEYSVAERYIRRVNNIEQKVEAYSKNLLVGCFGISQLHGWYNRQVGEMWRTDGIGNILYMENGCLTYEEEERTPDEIREIADSVEDFSEWLYGEGIPFYYVNAGSKVNPKDKQLSAANRRREFTNENGDALLQALAEREVNTLDMREYMLAEGLDWYDAYYRTDHHWKAETGLWAAGVTAKVLNEKEGFSFDPLIFDEASYEMTTYEDCFRGGQARGIMSPADIERDSFTCILPRFETDFYVEVPTKGLRLTGSYRDALYNYEKLGNALRYADTDYYVKWDPYSSTMWNNDALGIVKNRKAKCNEDKKILLLSDSFSIYYATYLACGVGEIHMMTVEAFDGSVRSYVKEMQPDVVILMYCESNILPIDWSTHTSMFDFR